MDTGVRPASEGLGGGGGFTGPALIDDGATWRPSTPRGLGWFGSEKSQTCDAPCPCGNAVKPSVPGTTTCGLASVNKRMTTIVFNC